MFSFLSPVFLLGAAAAAIPVVLHLLKRHPEERVKFAAVSLLRRASVEDIQRRHLRELLLLALRVAALFLLAMAFARPLLSPQSASRPAGFTVVALDTSLSLSAPGQFDRAKQLARDAVRLAPRDDLVGVVTFAAAAHTVAKPSEDRALAVAAIDAAEAGFGATRYRSAFHTASELIRTVGAVRSTIVVVTDMQASGWDAGDRASVPESDRKSTRLNSSHIQKSRMPSSA